MTIRRSEVRPGVYHDSIVLMQLQAALARLPDVMDAAAVMGTAQNLSLLSASGMRPDSAEGLGPDDLVVVIEAETEEAAGEALERIDDLLSRRDRGSDQEFRPRSLASAIKLLPVARCALVSVPGRFAARVTREALERGLHVFLYSDNVRLADEVELKREAETRGLLLMGPDCGTAIINGVGLGFANRVRRGPIGLVGATGTGLQAISSRIHARGLGVSHAIGTGGRDLHVEVGAITARQALSLFHRDPGTEVIVLVSKPPDAEVARSLLRAARETGKPVVVHFPGQPPRESLENLHFANSLRETADLAVRIAGQTGDAPARGMAPAIAPDAPATTTESPDAIPEAASSDRRYLRGLFAGGTLALEAAYTARRLFPALHSNLPVEGVGRLEDPSVSRGHTILDLGSDEFTVGRLHPMMDNELRLRRMAGEALDPETGVILLDVVLGEGAHPDPAAELAPVIEAAPRGGPEFVAIVVGTDEDPQGLAAQVDRLAEAGARVFEDVVEAVRFAARQLGSDEPGASPAPESRSSSADEPLSASAGTVPAGTVPAEPAPAVPATAVKLDFLQTPLAAINIGVETFFASLLDQGADVVHVDWRPPAGGDEKLLSLLDRLKT
jgi:FdrA protein